jgi:predicted DNA-binding transcriptional regulator YafY/biotin operon repressor
LARESFDKEIQFLRMLVLTSGAYSRPQFAEKLGISVHTFDKMLRRLKEIAGPEFATSLHNSYYESTDPMLLFLFRAKSLKESESQRIAILMAAIHEQASTALELFELCSLALTSEATPPDEKTIRNDLKYLENVGVICKQSEQRPYRYRIQNELIQQLTADELIDLYDFIDIMANTQVPSVQGYLLRDGLKKHMNRSSSTPKDFEVYLYKYHYYSRILDEAHLFTLLEAIKSHRKVRFLYFSPKITQSYTSRNTNPLYEREMNGKEEITLPLKIIYDHQYGRWYLLSHNIRHGIKKYRLEGITQLVEEEAVGGAFYEEKKIELEKKIKHSWLIDTSGPVTIQMRFYNPDRGDAARNFVKDRVQLHYS